MASPPRALISSTTLWAGPAETPLPSREPPMSLTTSLAPSFANSSAWERPMPPPAPVTTTTRPSHNPLMRFLPSNLWPSLALSGLRGRLSVDGRRGLARPQRRRRGSGRPPGACDRQAHREGGPDALGAVHVDAAAMGGHQGSDDGKS